MSRAFCVVLDAVGAGPLPDSAEYGDRGADTLVHLAQALGGLELPTLGALGLGCVRGIAGVPPVADAGALHGRLRPTGPGKDSTTGHWELMGVVAPAPLPTYPDGLPATIRARLEAATGVRFCCGEAYSGTQVIEDFGRHHQRTGEVIAYTSVDSVLQLAAHVDVLAPEALYALCAEVRALMTGPDAVGRVIARPFAGAPGSFARTDGRRDLSVPPPGPSTLEAVAATGQPVVCVGKTADLFAGVGVTERRPGATNARALAEVDALLDELDTGLVFANLVETDQVYGHRKDLRGFHAALQAIDAAVASWLPRLREDDLLILTADHGVDPAMPHADHTREHVPLLAVFAGHGGRRHDGDMGDVGASIRAWLAAPGDPGLGGLSFVGTHAGAP